MSSWLQNKAGHSVPKATRAAPVSVAKSTMKSGLSSIAKSRTSASTRRPSASVLPTSTLMPALVSMISSGRIERSETAFSAAPINTRKRTGISDVIMAKARPRTCAEPPISFFIISIAPAGFKSRPPESNVTPLPTKVIRGPLSPHIISIKQGWISAARPTV